MTRVALVTAASARHLDEDLPPLIAALEHAGATPEVVVWDDDAVDWEAFDLTVIRSTWDYAGRRREFLEWAQRAASVTRLLNPEPVLRWNTDKRYLRDLAACGVPTVPTTWPERDGPVVLPDGELVVKPVVGAGAVDTERYEPTRRAQAVAHVERLHREGRAVMVQPYLTGVDDRGETALVFFGGRFSHAVRKGPILRADGTVFVEGLYAAEEIRATTATAAELDVARVALDAVPHGPLAYARVDVVPDDGGAPLVLEVELTEPSVFLGYAAGSADRFAGVLLGLVPRAASRDGGGDR